MRPQRFARPTSELQKLLVDVAVFIRGPYWAEQVNAHVTDTYASLHTWVQTQGLDLQLSRDTHKDEWVIYLFWLTETDYASEAEDEDIPESVWDVDGAGTTGFVSNRSNRAY